ncbi:MAG: NAD(+) synthase, partial [Candidatus Kapabacteria bacterium]|nr:NAD(+) synthase [Candidatus Kapabacteria bacterium]
MINPQKTLFTITNWLLQKLDDSRQSGFVVGVSGGIDSATVSTCCAKTGKKLIALNMPIHQPSSQLSRAEEQCNWLKLNFTNVETFLIDLTEIYETIIRTLPLEAKNEIALVNLRSRLRMMTLYSFANSNNFLVAGTGNKVEDYGIGFFTKYGDGGVDISPIGDLTKTEVYQLAAYLDVPESIQKAAPTDGLWEIDRTDEEQIGATYPELEWAMDFCEKKSFYDINKLNAVIDASAGILYSIPSGDSCIRRNDSDDTSGDSCIRRNDSDDTS